MSNMSINPIANPHYVPSVSRERRGAFLVPKGSIEISTMLENIGSKSKLPNISFEKRPDLLKIEMETQLPVKNVKAAIRSLSEKSSKLNSSHSSETRRSLDNLKDNPTTAFFELEKMQNDPLLNNPLNKELTSSLKKNIDKLQILYEQLQRAQPKNIQNLKDQISTKNERIAKDFEILKAADSAQKIKKHSLIKQGKVKQVWKSTTKEDSKYVYYTAIKGVFDKIVNSKEREMLQEVDTAKQIQSGLYRHNLEKLLYGSGVQENTLTTIMDVFGTVQDLKKALDENRLQEQLSKVLNPKEMTKIRPLLTSHEIQNWSKSGSNIAINLEKVEGDEQVEGQTTIRTERAVGDLEDEIKIVRNSEGEKIESPTNQDHLVHFNNKVRLGKEFLNGMKDLHDAGFVQGDLKLENILVYHEKNEQGHVVSHLKISDLGKTKKISEREEVFHTGNYRFMPFEGKLSKKAEVFSSALVLIRMLEEGLPKKDGLPGEDGMLLKPSEFSLEADSNRRGVEKFLVANKKTPQTETLRGKVRVVSGVVARQTKDFLAAKKELDKYIDELINRLGDTYSLNITELRDLGDLLKKMTAINPDYRPSLTEALGQYQEISKNL